MYLPNNDERTLNGYSKNWEPPVELNNVDDISMDREERTTTTNIERRRTVVGPWKSIKEFHKVHNYLYGDLANNESRARALSQMRIWNVRRSTLCPAAVCATAVLLEVQLKDANNAAYEPEELQTLYASAFMRFFNFMSSIMQTHNMRTMYETAQNLGLESFVVDLRHICAHGQVLPPLHLLRNTSNYCMRWLRDFYWNAQVSEMRDVDASGLRRTEKSLLDKSATQLFGIYDTALECFMKGATNLKTAKRHVHGNRFTALKQFYNEKNLQALSEGFDVIVKELTALVRREVAIKDLPEIFIEALLKMKYFLTIAVDDKIHATTKHLETIIELTQTLFRMLATFGFIEDLFQSLLQIAENQTADPQQRSGASFWAQQIVAGFVAFRRSKRLYKAELDEYPNNKEYDFYSLNLEHRSKKVRKLLIYAGVDLKRTLLFGDSFRRPWVWVFDRDFVEDRLDAVNEYTAPVLQSLLPLIEPSLDTTEIKAFTELINPLFIPFDAPITAKNENALQDDKIYTAADLLTRLRKTDKTDNYSIVVPSCEKEKFGIWTVMQDDETHNWSSCALGRLPWE